MDKRGDRVQRWTDVQKVMLSLRLISAAWLVVLGEPLAQLFRARLPPLALSLALLGVAVFVAIYLGMVFRSDPYGTIQRSGASTWSAAVDRGEGWRGWGWPRHLPLILLTVLGVVYTIAFGNAWLDLLVFTGVAVAYRLPIREAAWTLPLVAILALGLGVLVNHGPGAAPAFLLILSIGIGVAGGIYARTMVLELRAARGELARLAVSEERLRFARDLHDLLGHSLSLIALKSELAGQLAPTAPERAAAEMRDVENVARTALREVREAVAGYRQPTLPSELAGAAELLAAAGVAGRIEGDLGSLSPRVEAALAWTVREGVTNVIRHSRARSCAIRLARDSERVVVEVTDDGEVVAADLSGSGGRSGLAGLAERVAAVGGKVEAGPVRPRGFRLVATVPQL